MEASSKKQHYFSKPSTHHHCSATVTTPETSLESHWPSSSSSMSEYDMDDGRRNNRSSRRPHLSSNNSPPNEALFPPVVTRRQPVHQHQRDHTKKGTGSRSKSMGPSSNNMRWRDTADMVHSSSRHHSRPQGPSEGSSPPSSRGRRGGMRRDESHSRPHSPTNNNRPRRTFSCPPSPQQHARRPIQPSSRMSSSNNNYDRPHQVPSSRGQPTLRNNGRARGGPTPSSNEQLVRRSHSSSNQEHPAQQANDDALALVVRERTPSRTTTHRSREEKNDHLPRERREEHQLKNQAQKNQLLRKSEEEQQRRCHRNHREHHSSSSPSKLRHRSVPPPQEKRLHQQQTKMIEYKPTVLDDAMSTKALPSRRHTASSNKKYNWGEVKSDTKSRATKSSKKSNWGEVKCDIMISSSNKDSTKSKSQSEHKKTTSSKSSRDVQSKLSGVEGTKSLYSKEDKSRVSKLRKEDYKSRVSELTKETSLLFRAHTVHSPPTREKSWISCASDEESLLVSRQHVTTTKKHEMSTKALPSRRHTASSNKKYNWGEVKSDTKSRATKSSKKSNWGEVKCDIMISSSNKDSTKSKSQSEHKKTTSSKSSRDVQSKLSGVEGTKSLYSKEDKSRVSKLRKEDYKSRVSELTKETSLLFRAHTVHSPPTREKSWISCASDEESLLVSRQHVTTTKKHDSLAAHRAKARQLDVSMRTKSTHSSSIRGSLRSQESKARNEPSILQVKESSMHDSSSHKETTAAQDQEAKMQDFFEQFSKIIGETKKKKNSRSKSRDSARAQQQRPTQRHEPVKERRDTWRDESNVELAMRLIEKNKGTKMSTVKSSDEEDMHVQSSSRSRSKSRHSSVTRRSDSPPRHESKAMRRAESSSSSTNSPPRPAVVHDTPLRFIPERRTQLPTPNGIPEPTFNENSLIRRESGPAYSSKPIPPPPSRRNTVAGPGVTESAMTSMRTPAISKSANLMMNSPPPPPPPRINRYNNNVNSDKTNHMLYSASEPSFTAPPLPLSQPGGEITDHSQSDYLNQYPDADTMPDTSKEWLKYATKGSQRRQEAADDGSTRRKSKMFGRKKSGIEEQVKAMSVKQMPFTDQFGDFGYYSGQVNDDGRPDGTGIMKYENGVFYEGPWSNGCQDKLAASQYERIRGGFTSWSGKGKGGVKSGSTLPWNAKNNDKHSNEKTNVRGMEWTDLNGDTGRYTGEVDDDQLPHGSGIMKYDFGLIAEGDWVHGVLREGPMDRMISAAAMSGGGSVAPGMINSGMSVGPGASGYASGAVSVLGGGGAMSVAPMGFGGGPGANGFNNSAVSLFGGGAPSPVMGFGGGPGAIGFNNSAVSVFSGGGAPSPVQFMGMNPSQRAYIAQQNAMMKSSMNSIMSTPSGSFVHNGAGSVYGGAGSVYGNSGSFYGSVNSGMQMQPIQQAQYQQQMAMMQHQQMVLQQQYQCQQQYQPQNLHEEVDMPMKPPVPNIVIR